MAELRGIHSISSVPFGPNAPFTGAAEESLLEEWLLNQGGFGAVYRILTVDGRSVQGALVKAMFDQQHGEHAPTKQCELHDKLRGRFHETLTTEHPELLGMPFMLFRAMNDQDEPVVAMALCDLGALGFDDMGERDGWGCGRVFPHLPWTSLHLAYQFARTVDLLH